MCENLSPFRPDVLSGHVALITGGSSGIGLEIARALGQHGARIAICGRRQRVLQDAAEDLGRTCGHVLQCQGDVRNDEDAARWVRAAVETFGKLSIVVNCAAGNFLATAESLSAKGFKTVMDIDAAGTFNVARTAFPALHKAQGARIINISAMLHQPASWFQVHASAAKAAVDSVTRSLALEWGRFGITVNAVAPGPIQGTAGIAKLAPGKAEEMMQTMTSMIPVGRMGKATDIALACVYLCCQASGFISGHVLVVDGGSWLWKPELIPYDAVAQISRSVEASSRNIGMARSKL